MAEQRRSEDLNSKGMGMFCTAQRSTAKAKQVLELRCKGNDWSRYAMAQHCFATIRKGTETICWQRKSFDMKGNGNEQHRKATNSNGNAEHRKAMAETGVKWRSNVSNGIVWL